LFLGALLTLYLLLISLKFGLSAAVGVIFSLLNIYLLSRLIRETIKEGERDKRNIAGLLILKFLVLWGGTIVLLAIGWIDPLFFAIGFSVILLVFALRGFGGWLYGYFFQGK